MAAMNASQPGIRDLLVALGLLWGFTDLLSPTPRSRRASWSGDPAMSLSPAPRLRGAAAEEQAVPLGAPRPFPLAGGAGVSAAARALRDSGGPELPRDSRSAL